MPAALRNPSISRGPQPIPLDGESLYVRSTTDGVTSAPDDASNLHGTPHSEQLEEAPTVFLNKSTDNAGDITEKSVARLSHSMDTQEEPRKCWICYTDETEESPLNSQWRSPCPCALTAHEACLLDWLADLENPRTRRRNGGGSKMQCPQCKSEIVVTRPRSYIVDLLRVLERLAGRLILPGMVFTLAGTVWAGCCAHGVYSTYLIFGPEDAKHIIEDSIDGTWNPGLSMGLPLIPIVLIFSRTRYAEGLSPPFPFSFSQHTARVLNLILTYGRPHQQWPLLLCPIGLERKWIAEVQPRAAEEILDDAQQQDQAEGLHRFGDNGNDHVFMEIDLALQVGVPNDDEPADAQALPAVENNNGADEAAQDGHAQPEQNQNNGQGLDLGRRQNEIIADTGNIAETVLGALVFPAISAAVGGLLKKVLPTSWTTPTTVLERSRPGLLQTRWGRSVIGGCAFVILKDALVLYCRWKLAQTHRRRKVLNYDKKKRGSLRE
ncbi:hypothetical protein N7470_002090 [Penicillium chermesinum]|nr:hypothetical protein N7470_002090 [Penicillium chermesinum]